MALAAYRSLFRATRIAFQGDQATLLGARNRIREEFRNHSSNPADPEYQKRIAHAQEVASFLRSNVVQGVREGEGNFRLNIHAETERGDNDSIKQPKGMSSGGGCGCK